MTQTIDTATGEVTGEVSEHGWGRGGPAYRPPIGEPGTFGTVPLPPLVTPPHDGKEPSLIRKLAEVMAETEAVEKRGWHDQQKYHYVLPEDLLQAVRGAMAARQIVLLHDEIDREHRTVPTTNGQMPLVDLRVRFSFVDGESGETYSFQLTGTGADHGGTGAGKAMTAAMKGALAKTFLIPMGDGSAEATPSAASGRESDAQGSRQAQSRKGGRGAQGASEWRWPFAKGGDNGKPITEVSTQNLEWFRDSYETRDPKYAEQDRQRKEWVTAELERRAGAGVEGRGGELTDKPARESTLGELAALCERGGHCAPGEGSDFLQTWVTERFGDAGATEGWAREQITKAREKLDTEADTTEPTTTPEPAPAAENTGTQTGTPLAPEGETCAECWGTGETRDTGATCPDCNGSGVQ